MDFEDQPTGPRIVETTQDGKTAYDDGLGLAEGLGRVGVEQVNQRQAVTGSQADYGGQRMPATAEQNGGMNHERIQGGSQIGGDSGQIARAADDGQLAARTAGPADSGQWDAGLGSDRQAGGLGEGTGSTAVRSGERGSQRAAEQARLRNQIRALETERTSAKQIGIQGGTKNESLRVVPEELYTSEMREIANEVAELGQKVTFVAGAMEVRGRSGKTGKANGIHQISQDGSVQYFIRADSAKYTAGTIFKHESFHELVSGNQNLWLDMVEDLFKTHTEEEVYMMVDAYVEALDGIYGVYEEGMTEDKQAALRNKYLEEIFADQYAGMNRGGGKQAAARGVAGETAQRFAGDIENARQNRAGIDRRNGPGVRFSEEDYDHHTPREREIMREYEQAVDQKLLSFIHRVRGLQSQSYKAKQIYPLSSMSERQIADIRGILGQDTTGFRNAINGTTITHIENRHGVNGKADHSMENEEDIARINYVLQNYDDVRLLVDENGQPIVSTEWTNNDGTRAKQIQYSKKIDGIYYVIEAAIDSKKQTHMVTSAYMNEKGSAAQSLNMEQSSPQLTSETPNGSNTSNDSIPQTEQSVNTNPEDAVDWEGNREQRLSVSEDADDDSLGVDWIGSREENADARTAASTETENPSSVTEKSVTPSPEGEGSETGGQAARVTENAQAMAREKKVSIAEKASIEGLKSRIESAETRLRALNEMEATGLLAKDAQSQKEWKQQIKDVEESLDIFRNALDDKKAKRKAAKEAEKNNKELKAQRKQARAA